ncbi:MAG: hypothetical protein IKA11_00540 [Clostridia bacterium]|nr:hypothetical protein [Clostridia bacterium]
MYYYFSADYPAIIKINGIYYGSITETVKSLRLENCQPPFIEVCPLGSSDGAFNFILDENFLSHPFNRATVTDLIGGFLIKFEPQKTGGDFKVYRQEKFSNAIVTVFNENGCKISVETEKDFLIEPVNVSVFDASIFLTESNNKNLLAVNVNGKPNMLYLFDFDDKIRTVFSRAINSFNLDGGIFTTETPSDIVKHKITARWEWIDGAMKETSRTIERKSGFDSSKVPLMLIPYVFIEERLVGSTGAEYLSEGVKENLDKISSYLGEFIGVMPPPVFRKIEEVGLIYKNGENKYKVNYFTFEIENGKICNIKKSAD